MLGGVLRGGGEEGGRGGGHRADARVHRGRGGGGHWCVLRGEGQSVAGALRRRQHQTGAARRSARQTRSANPKHRRRSTTTENRQIAPPNLATSPKKTSQSKINQAGGYGRVVSSVLIGLRTVKGVKQLKLDPTIYDSLQKERVQVGDQKKGRAIWKGGGSALMTPAPPKKHSPPGPPDSQTPILKTHFVRILIAKNNSNFKILTFENSNINNSNI